MGLLQRLPSVAIRHAAGWINHPVRMAKELGYVYQKPEDPPTQSKRWCSHSHTRDSFDGSRTGSELIPRLMDLGIDIWSPTDHGNTHFFDRLHDEKEELQEGYVISKDDNHDRYVTITNREIYLTILRACEILTDEGEIGAHGYIGDFEDIRKTGGKLPLTEAIQRVKDQGGYSIGHHLVFWEGMCWNRKEDILKEAIEAGLLGWDLNAVEGLPQIQSGMFSRLMGEKFDRPVIASPDAHHGWMYDKETGVYFHEQIFCEEFYRQNHDMIRTMESMLLNGKYTNVLAYLNLREIQKFFKHEA